MEKQTTPTENHLQPNQPMPVSTWMPSSQSLITLILKSSEDPESAITLIEKQSSMTPALALTNTSQISLLRKENKSGLLKSVSVLITGLRKSINVGKNMDTLQVYECASLLIEKYWYLRLEEFMYVFKQAKLGKYGKVYDRLDVLVISGWLDAYDTTERLAEVARQREKAQKANYNEPLSIEAVQACYKKLASGGKLDYQLAEEKKKQAAIEAHQKEVEFFRIQQEYFRSKKQQIPESAQAIPTPTYDKENANE